MQEMTCIISSVPRLHPISATKETPCWVASDRCHQVISSVAHVFDAETRCLMLPEVHLFGTAPVRFVRASDSSCTISLEMKRRCHAGDAMQFISLAPRLT